MKKFGLLFVFISVPLIVSQAIAERLSYEDVLKEALNNSGEIKSADIEKKIRQETVKETRYGLFPDLSIRFNTEYTDNFTDGMGDIVIGDTMISGSTRYQNALSLNLTYPILDYGSAGNRMKIAETEASQGEDILMKTRMDVETSVLEKYSELYSLYTESLKRKEIVSVHERLSELEKRSNIAGISGKQEVAYQDILLIEEKEKLDAVEARIATVLEDIGFLTGKEYKAQNIEVMQIPDADDPDMLDRSEDSDHTANPEYRYYSAEKKKKEIEKDIVKNDFYPKLNVYARYNFYGSNKDIHDTYERLREKGYSVGLFTSIPITENIKRIHTLEKSELGIKKSEIEAEKKLGEIRRDFSKLREEYAYLKKDVKKKKERLAMMNARHDMIRRLEASKVVGKKDLLEEMILLSVKEVELERQIAEQTKTMKKIMIQMKGGN